MAIIKNRNGNYFCTDLLKVCNKYQRIKILKELSTTLSEDCTDEFGTHPIQSLIELACTEEEYKLLLLSFNDYNKVLMACLNQNGSFVIQKLIENCMHFIKGYVWCLLCKKIYYLHKK